MADFYVTTPVFSNIYFAMDCGVLYHEMALVV